MIHETAIVDPQAILGVEVLVGPYAVVEAGATVDGMRLKAGHGLRPPPIMKRYAVVPAG